MSPIVSRLRAAIAANVSDSSQCRAAIHASSGPERDRAWRAKRAVGEGTRAMLLALAFARGVPYARVESDRTVNPPKLHAIVGHLEPDDVAARGARYDAVAAWVEVKPAAAAERAAA